MRISQLSLAGRRAWPDLHIDPLSPQLNVFFAAPRGGKSAVARLVGHLLYGKTESPWRLQLGQSVPMAEGTISLEGTQGQYVLRRRCGTDRQERLTIASSDGSSVDSQTVRKLLSTLDPEVAAQLFAVDFAESPAVDCLLSKTFIRQFIATQQKASRRLGILRASDVLAQLTGGKLVGIRLERHSPAVAVVARSGRILEIESLTAAQHDAIYLALTLALVDSYAGCGIELPLILDEPFLRQDPSSADAMAEVLEEFSRSGHQLLVFTEDHDARRRFGALGTRVFDLDSLRRKPVTPTNLPTELKTKTTTTDLDGNDVYYLAESSPLSEFPLFGNETGELFLQIGIRSVGDLLAADVAEVARQLGRDGIHPETVGLWQTHMRFMCFLPKLTLKDAQLLSACGFTEPEQLFGVDAKVVTSKIMKFSITKRGRQILRNSTPPSWESIEEWIECAAQIRLLEVA